MLHEERAKMPVAAMRAAEEGSDPYSTEENLPATTPSQPTDGGMRRAASLSSRWRRDDCTQVDVGQRADPVWITSSPTDEQVPAGSAEEDARW